MREIEGLSLTQLNLQKQYNCMNLSGVYKTHIINEIPEVNGLIMV
jgi:hypothetical protein